MKTKLLLFHLFIASLSFGQGLNAEHGLNNGYNQSASGIVCVGEYTYLTSFHNMPSSYFSQTRISKLDSLDNILWQKVVSPAFSDILNVHDIIPSETGGVYVSGYLRLVCDMAVDCKSFILKYDPNGNIEWTKLWNDASCNGNYITGLSLNAGNTIVFNRKSGAESFLVTLNPEDGSEISSLPILFNGVEGFQDFSGSGKAAFKQKTLYAFEGNGNETSITDFHTDIQDIGVLNDTLYVLTQDSIFQYGAGFQKLNGNIANGFVNYSNLKLADQSISFISGSSSGQHVIRLNKELEMTGVTTIPVHVSTEAVKDFNDLHFSVGMNYPITKFEAIRYQDYSMKSEENASINTTDIAVIDFFPTQVDIIPSPSVSNIYTVEIYGDVLIKNVGTNTLTDCRINHYISEGIACGDEAYFNHFSELNLEPNDSMWVSLGKIHRYMGLLTESTESMEICVYSSNPNFKTDLNVSNDEFCKPVYVRKVGLEEKEIYSVSLFPNPTNGIMKIQASNENLKSYAIYNLQGQELKREDLTSEEIDLSFLSSGLYMLRFTFSDGSIGKGNVVVKE